MGNGDEGIGEYDFPGDIHLVEDYPLDRYLDFGVSGQPVSHDEGSTGFFVGESVIESLDDMIYGVGASTSVQGAGFSQKGESVILLHPGDDRFDEIRTDMGVVIPFTYVELDRHLVFGFDDPFESRCLDQFFSGGQPLPQVAVGRKLSENNP